MMNARRTFPARIADLGFSMEVPEGFEEPDYPREDQDFSDPTKSAPLALLASPVAMAVLCVAARPAYENGSVDDWIRFLAGHFEITIEGNVSGFVGGTTHQHPAVLIEGTKQQDGVCFVMRLVALEDGGRLVTAHAMCPEELWPSYGAGLQAALASLELENPRGPTVSCVPNGPVPILDMPGITTGEWPMGRGKLRAYEAEREQKRQAAVDEARAMIERGEFDEAELLVRRTDSSIQGGVALERLYEARLRELVASAELKKDKQRLEAVYRRALSWAQGNYPEPHTQDEADSYEQGRAEDLGRLVGILGYQPGEG